MNKKTNIKQYLHRFIEGPGNLQITAIIIISVIVLNALFSLDVTVSRKPLLNKILKQPSVSAPVTNSPSLANQQSASSASLLSQSDQDKIIPPEGMELPAVWGDVGRQMAAAGVIDKDKIETLYAQRGGVSEYMKKMINEKVNEKIKITPQNSGELLNLLWALGLGNKNEILDEDMKDPKYGGDASKFASTGGWTLASGNVMDHYGKHSFISLNKDQQAMVDRVSKGIYRPCCGNSTHFPDCNHGMAMLGLLQLMASQSVNEQDMYTNALAVNAYWFPDTYLTIAQYLKTKNREYAQTSPQELLSSQYSSAQGYRQILSQVQPVQGRSSGGCGV